MLCKEQREGGKVGAGSERERERENIFKSSSSTELFFYKTTSHLD